MCEDPLLSDQQQYRYMTVDDMKSLGDDSLQIDVTRDERAESNRVSMDPSLGVSDLMLSSNQTREHYQMSASSHAPDNVDIYRQPVHVGIPHWKNFLVSFLVDARGGAMRGCRHSGVRVIVPPRKAPMPMRVTCRYLRKDKLSNPPPLMEGEALASRILELGPVGAKFLGPVIIEVPHFASLRGKEREIVILRSDNGDTWREHTLDASEEAVQDVLNESFEGEEMSQLEDLHTNRITRILTVDFPHYFAVMSRTRQEVHAIGPEGGMVSSSVVPQVQAVFPPAALTKKIRVGIQAQPIPTELVTKLLGNRVAVSPIVTVEPRRRKFHKPITLTIPVPQAASKGMINPYSGDVPTLRLLCSITGGTTRAQWEDVTGSTPLTFVKDCVTFTTTVSARFWLMDCRNIGEATRMATELYKEATHPPFMAKFVVFAKRVDFMEARLRVFCMTDDREDKTLEHQEHFTEVAKSRDVEVLEGKPQYIEFAGNLIPVMKSGDQLQLGFHAFRENRLPFTVRVKDQDEDTVGRILFMQEPKVAKGEPPQTPICTLNIVLPENIVPNAGPSEPDLLELEKNYSFLKDGISHPDSIHRADIRLSDISNLLGADWLPLASELGISTSDVNLIKTEYPHNVNQQATIMLQLWQHTAGNKATGNTLEKALRKIDREDIVNHCVFNIELVTDDMEKAVAKVQLDQSGFDALRDELGPSRDATLRHSYSSLDPGDRDFMKESESVEELGMADTPSYTNDSGTVRSEEEKYTGEEKDLEDMMEEFLAHKQQSTSTPMRQQHTQPDVSSTKQEMFQDVTEQLERLETTSPSVVTHKQDIPSPMMSQTPPPSPAEYHDQLGVEQYPDEGTHVSQSKTWEPEDLDINLISNRQLPTLVQGMSEAGPEHAHSDTAPGSSVVVSSHDAVAALHEEGIAATSLHHIKPTQKVSGPSKRTSSSQLDDIEWDFGSDDDGQGVMNVKTVEEHYSSEASVDYAPGSIQTREEVFVNVVHEVMTGIEESCTNEPFHSASEFSSEIIARSKDLTNDFLEGERRYLTDAPPLLIRDAAAVAGDNADYSQDDSFKENGGMYGGGENRQYQGSIHSDSDCDSHGSPMSPESRVSLTKRKTLGSSSGSDVALHEGAELSEDEQHSGAEYFQGNEDPIYTETISTEYDPDTQRRVITTTRTVTMSTTGTDDNDGLRQSMQEIVDKFMTDERQHP